MKQKTKNSHLPLIAALVLLIGLMSVLLGMNYFWQRQGQEKTVQRMQTELDARGERLGLFLNRFRADTRLLAESQEVDAFFKSRALGMSMEYGLKASLDNIRQLFAQRINNIDLGHASVYQRIALLDLSLATLTEWPEGGTPQIDLRLQAHDRISFTSRQGRLDIVRKVVNGGSHQGYLVVSVDYRALHGQLHPGYEQDGVQCLMTLHDDIVFPAFVAGANRRMAELAVRLKSRPAYRPSQQDMQLFADAGSDPPPQPALFFTRVEGYPFSIYQLISADELYSRASPTVLLVAMLLFSATVVAFTLRLVRSASRNQALNENLRALQQREEALREKNSEIELIISGAELGTWVWDMPAGRIRVNEQWARMLGYDVDELELTPANWSRLVHPDDWRRVQKELKHLLAKDPGTHITDHRLRHRSGKWIWVRSVGQVFSRDATGTPLLVKGIQIEITELKNALKQAEAARQEADSVISNFLDSLLVVDRELKVSRINKETCSLLGYHESDLLGKPVRRLFAEAPATVETYFNAPGSAGAAGQPELRNIELSFLTAAGKLLPVSINLAQVKNKQGETIGVVAGAKDISTLKQTLRDAEQQRTFIENILDIIPGGLLVIGPDSGLIRHNRTFDQLLQSWSGAYNLPADILRRDILARLAEHLPQRRSGEFRLTSVRGDLTVEYHASDTAGDGTVSRVVFLHDVTERQRAEAARKLQSTVLEQTSEGVIVTDTQTEIQFANLAAQTISGYSAAELLGQKTSLFKSSAHDGAHYRRLWQTILAGNVWSGSLTNQAKDGSRFEVEATISPVRNDRNRITHYVALWRDVRQERALQQQLLQAQKLEAVGQLAAGVAHEINTPIQYIQNNLSFFKTSYQSLTILLDTIRNGLEQPELLHSRAWQRQVREQAESCDLEFLREEIPQGLDEALEGIDQVTRIVSAMKEFSHPGTAEKVPTDLNRLIESAVVVTRNEWKYVSELELQLAPDLPLLFCDPGSWSQILLNLIINSADAIKATETGNAPGRIVIATRAGTDNIEVVVRDNGCGIEVEAKDRIFEPFYTTKDVGKGTGQGLAIVYDLVVNKHGGTIVCDSEPGRGSAFTIRVPANGQG